MLFTALAYSWYQDKNRQTLPELFDASQNKNENGEASPPEDVKSAYVRFILFFIVEVMLLLYVVPLAFQTARTRTELFVHLFFAIVFTPIYALIAVASQVWARPSSPSSLFGPGPQTYKSGRSLGEVRYVRP